MKVIKKLGSGMFGTTYLVDYNGKKYALKTQHILPSDRHKDYKRELWRELDLYAFIKRLKPSDRKFFTQLYEYKIYKDCQHKQIRPFKLGKDKWSNKMRQLNKSEWCVDYMLDYHGDKTLGKYLATHNITPKQAYSFALQLCKIMLILYKGGYSHNDLHMDNVMITKTSEKYFTINGKKVPYYGYQLVSIDYGEVLHKKHGKFKEDYKEFLKDRKRFLFTEIVWSTFLIFSKFDKYMYQCKKKKMKMPWEKEPLFQNNFRKILINHPKFWKESKNQYLDMFPSVRNKFNRLEKKLLKKPKKDIFKFKNYYMREIINRINYKFQTLYPILYTKYFLWCSVNKPVLPTKNMLDLLEIKTTDKFIEYISGQIAK